MRDSRRTRLVLAVLLLVSVTLITIDLRGGEESAVDGPRGVVASVFGPVQSAAAAVVRPVAGAIEAIGNIGRNQQKIDDLEAEVARLQDELRTRPFDEARAAQLDELLGLAGRGRYRTVPAQVVAVGPGQDFAWTATIDVGTDDGVDVDMTVVSADGLVGRVLRASARTSTVLLANDPVSTVGARVEGAGELALLTGRGADSMELQLLDTRKQVQPGDRLVTHGSASGRPFVPGVPIGEIIEVRGDAGALTRVATVRPYVSFTALDVVGVVVEPPPDDPRDAVLPPVPSDPDDTADDEGDGGSGNGGSGDGDGPGDGDGGGDPARTEDDASTDDEAGGADDDGSATP